MRFNPKEGGPAWTAFLSRPIGSGYDLVLMLDRVEWTNDGGWMLELGINAAGSVCGQITAHPGYDALAAFTCTQDTLTIQDNKGGPKYVLSDAEGHTDKPSDVKALETAIQALRSIYDGSSVTGRWIEQKHYEAVGHDPSQPDDGYYDRENPPEGYSHDGWAGSKDDPHMANPLTPAIWEEYTKEEQDAWSESSAWIAKRALEAIGVPLKGEV